MVDARKQRRRKEERACGVDEEEVVVVVVEARLRNNERGLGREGAVDKEEVRGGGERDEEDCGRRDTPRTEKCRCVNC